MTQLILLCTGPSAHAQAPALRFKHLGIADGLSQSSVYCLFQDSKGFIWIGTTDGLSRYDGYGFRHFKHDPDNAHSLGNNELLSIAEDKQGNLLIGTAGGLDLFDPGKESFSRVLVRDTNKKLSYVYAILRDSQGRIWIGCRSGLMRYDPSTRSVSPVQPGISGLSGSVPTIAEDSHHQLWLGYGNSIIHYDPVSARALPLPTALSANPWFGKSRVCMIRVDSAQNVWIGTERDGLLVLKDIDVPGRIPRCINYRADSPNPISNDMIRAISFYKGNAWIGNRNGLYLISPSEKVAGHYVIDKYDAASLSGNSILCFMQDNAGSIWTGTFAGGISIDQPGNDNFNYIREQLDGRDGLNNRVVSRIAETPDGNLWIATEGGGVNYYDRRSGNFKYIHLNSHSLHQTNQEIVKSIQPDGRNLWIGTLEGLFRYNADNHSLKPYILAEQPARLLDEQVYGLAKDSSGLWIGTKGGLFRLDAHDQLRRFRHNAKDSGSLLSNDINALALDRTGGLWIGTESGLSLLPAGNSSFINGPASDPQLFKDVSVLCIFEDNTGMIWVGTRGNGIRIIDRKKGRSYTIGTANGLAEDIVHGITQDQEGNIWVSFSQAIARIRKPPADFDPKGISITNYSVNNGLGTNEFLAAVCCTRSGEIMFGGVNGIVSFQPQKLVVNATPPPVVLTDLLIRNSPAAIDSPGSPLHRSITYTDTITLSADQAYFAIHFAALNYINARTNQYAYMLEGLEGSKQWYYVGNQQSATYTNLEAGEYTFKVRASNNDGVWSPGYASLHIKVLPPFWKTTWAYLGYFLIVSGILFAFYYYSLKNARLRNDLKMQRLNRDKDQELMQRKLSFFTAISHEIKTPLTLILSPIEKLQDLIRRNEKARAEHLLELMQLNGDRLLRLTNQLLDFRKLESGNLRLQVSEGDLTAFLGDIIRSFEAYSHHKDVQLAFSASSNTFPAWFDRDKLEKIIFNLLSNSFKFTPPGGHIRVSLEGGNSIIITVTDDGAGIAPQNLERIFYPFHHYNDTGAPVDGTGIGLALSRGLAAMHHGTLTVDSRQANAGQPGHTCFTLTLPMGPGQYDPGELTGMALQQSHPPPTDERPPAVDQSPSSANMPLPFADQSPPSPDQPPPFQDQTAPSPGPLLQEEKPVMLIVEDNEEVLAFIRAHFEDSGFTTHTATDGSKGWELAASLIPDVIISDVTMPGTSGTDLCRLVKGDPRTSHIPFILLTARTPLVFRMEGFETGADDYVTKPFSLALLQVRVNNLLTTRRLLQEKYRKEITLQPANIAISPAEEAFSSRLMAFIEDNMMEPTLNVEQLGREMNMSRVTLYRKIKALTNQSPIEFIRSARLKKAALLLRAGGYNVTEVAYMVGFSDVDYFRKWFKQEFGLTPRDFAGGNSLNGSHGDSQPPNSPV